MMRLERQQFIHQFDRGPATCFENIELAGCYFESCGLSLVEDPANRTLVRNVNIANCSQRGCVIKAAVFEDVILNGLKTHGQPLQVSGAVFKHVILQGKIDYLMLGWSLGTLQFDKPLVQRAFDVANAEYYRHVDWALDISQGEFKEIDIRGVPARLIRRDPATQVVVTRTKALQGRWRDLRFPDGDPSVWWVVLDNFMAFGHDDDVVLVAPKRSKDYAALLEGLHILREDGVAEPD
jgi:hypothetical protein